MASRAEFGFSTQAVTVARAFPASIQDKVILITGVNAFGLGGVVAKAMASQRPRLLILTGRSKSKVQNAIQDLRKTSPDVNCRFLELDLSSQTSVRRAAAEVMAYSENIDILINNAGVMAIPERRLSPEGIEMHLATNHLGHFLFTNLIIAKLLAASMHNPIGATRVVNVSGFGHMFSPICFTDYNYQRSNDDESTLPESELTNKTLLEQFGLPSGGGSDRNAPAYNPLVAYGQSKTANILMTLYLNQKLATHGIKSFSLHPGTIGTELSRHLDPKILEWSQRQPSFPVKTLEQGGSTIMVAALDPKLTAAGKDIYLDDCRLVEAAPWAVDSVAAEKLWKLSESLVGQTFNLV